MNNQPRCSRCHRKLTDAFSIAVGMGPECRGALTKKGWRFPKPKYRVSHGRVVFMGMIGKIAPPRISTEALPKKPKSRQEKVANEEHSAGN